MPASSILITSPSAAGAAALETVFVSAGLFAAVFVVVFAGALAGLFAVFELFVVAAPPQADKTIASDATLDLWDVQVALAGGKNGVGSELFEVTAAQILGSGTTGGDAYVYGMSEVRARAQKNKEQSNTQRTH